MTMSTGAVGHTPTGIVAIVPGWNESRTVGNVIAELKKSPWLDDVIFVDNNSVDGSALVAAREGARLVHMPVPGKGQAMAAGVLAADSPYVMFVDADLTGFTTDHVEQLARPVVEGRTQLTRGLFDKGGTGWPARFGPEAADRYTLARARVMPVLTGERVVPTSLFAQLHASEADGWAIETSLNRLASQQGLTWDTQILHGMSHLEKSEKYAEGGLQGSLANVKALTETMLSRAHYRWNVASGALASEPLVLDSVRGAFTVDAAALEAATARMAAAAHL